MAEAKSINPIIGAGIGAATGLIGMLGQRKREERAMRNQERLMGVQQQNQMRLNQQGADLQMDMWNKTNYGAQMEHMKTAGLNPGLMYGMSGGGATTTGSQGGGSAQSGSAPSPQPMEMGQMVQSAATAAQLSLLKAQKENIEADTQNKKAGARDTGASAENREMDNITKKQFGQDADAAEASNRREKAKAEGKIMFGKWADSDSGYEWYNKETNAENRKEQEILNEYKINLGSEEQQRKDIELLKEKIKSEVENRNLTVEKANEIWHKIRQGWTELGIQGAMKLITRKKNVPIPKINKK